MLTRRLVLLTLLMLPMAACAKPDLPTLLQDATYGLEAVCAIGQQTLPPVVCTDGLTVLSTAKALAVKDGDAARAGVKTLLGDLEMRQPQIVPWTHWLTVAL